MTTVEVRVLADVQVNGHAKTKGSLKAITTKHLVERPGVDRWRQLVADALQRDWEYRNGWPEGLPPAPRFKLDPVRGRVGVRIVTHLQPIIIKTVQPGDIEALSYNWILSQQSGDVDKHARLVLDALQDSGIIVNDSQVWDLYGHKRLARPGMLAGQWIQVWEIPENEPW